MRVRFISKVLSLDILYHVLTFHSTVASVGVMASGLSVSVDPQALLFFNKRYIGILEGDSNPPEVSITFEIEP